MLFVLLYDTVAILAGGKTITTDYREALQSQPLLTLAGTAYIVAHLLDRPKHFKRIDLFNGYALLFTYAGKKLVKRELVDTRPLGMVS